jgi:hypothetical protein
VQGVEQAPGVIGGNAQLSGPQQYRSFGAGAVEQVEDPGRSRVGKLDRDRP